MALLGASYRKYKKNTVVHDNKPRWENPEVKEILHRGYKNGSSFAPWCKTILPSSF